MNESCLILFADQKFTIVSENTVSDSEKSEIIGKVLPKGSHWKLYSGGRSLACFSLDSSNRFVLSYSLITNSAVTPIINFIVLQEYNSIAGILQRRLVGIQSAYFRRMHIFCDLSESQARLLTQNLISLRVSWKSEIPNIKVTKMKHNYVDAYQWRAIENAIISLSSMNMKKIVGFRTLSLQTDESLPLVGVAEKII